MTLPHPLAGEVAERSEAGEDLSATHAPLPELRACLSREAAEAVPGLVIGIGNPDRGDDAVGRIVARLLRDRDVQAVEHAGEATALLRVLEGVDQAWLIDAAQSGAPPGTVRRIDCATDAPMPRSTTSSHGFGVAEAVALARAFGTLPPHCIIYAIEAAGVTAGAALSPAVAHAAHEVAERILAELVTQPLPSCRHPTNPMPATDRR